ncbi:hypothetical protein LXL04_003386 [Taraxacum kok-saghyz]
MFLAIEERFEDSRYVSVYKDFVKAFSYQLVTLEDISKHGNWPMVAPVNPYTEFALIWKI